MAVPNDLGPFLVAWVQTQADLHTLVGERVYPHWRRQPDGLLPAISYQEISSIGLGSLRGLSGLQADLYQLDCYGRTRQEAHSIAGKVRGHRGDQRLDRYVGTLAATTVRACFCQDVREQPETTPVDYDLRTWVVQLDFKIWYDFVS